MGWLALAFIVFATLSPISDRPGFSAPLSLNTSLRFALLGLAFGLAYPARLPLVATIVLGSAVGLETLQLLTPDRHGRVLDAVVKAVGGICGISAGQLILFLLRTRISRAR